MGGPNLPASAPGLPALGHPVSGAWRGQFAASRAAWNICCTASCFVSTRDIWRLFGKSRVLPFHGCPEERILGALRGDNDFFATQAAACAARRAEIRAGLGAPQATVFLFCRNPAENVRWTCCGRLGELPADAVRAQVLVAGDGELRAECERAARELGVATVFAGFINQSRLPEVYAAADVLVLPSDAGETWGLVVNEAMASGRPAVVSRAVGCAADLVLPGQTGEVFELGDTAALAGILTRYLREPALAARQGTAASRHIQSFSYQQVIAGILTAVQTCARGARC